MGMYGQVNYGGTDYDLARIPGERTAAWESMAAEILHDYLSGPDARRELELLVVHPRDGFWNTAVVHLDADDWHPEWPVPFYTRHVPRYGGEWLIVEAIPQMVALSGRGQRSKRTEPAPRARRNTTPVKSSRREYREEPEYRAPQIRCAAKQIPAHLLTSCRG